MSESAKPTLVVLQASPFCNIDCSYCYLPNRDNRVRMSSDILEAILRQIFASNLISGSIEFLWHAGEPLAVPIAFYEKAFSLAKKIGKGREHLHSIQTNGTLLDENWIEFIRENDVAIGLSIDGPAFIHNRHRVGRNGFGTHEKALRGLRLLQDNEIEFSTIMVLTKFALDFPNEIYEFLLENRIKQVGLNIDEIENVNSRSSYEDVDAIEKYRRFIGTLLSLIDSGEPTIDVREFGKIYRRVLGIGSVKEELNSTNTPFAIFTFDYLGNYSTFCPELRGASSSRFRDFIMGNVTQNVAFDEILSNPIFREVSDEIQQGVNLCRENCDYFGVCGGGTPSNKYSQHGRFDVTETIACKVQKQTLTDAILDHLEASSYFSEN